MEVWGGLLHALHVEAEALTRRCYFRRVAAAATALIVIRYIAQCFGTTTGLRHGSFAP